MKEEIKPFYLEYITPIKEELDNIPYKEKEIPLEIKVDTLDTVLKN